MPARSVIARSRLFAPAQPWRLGRLVGLLLLAAVASRGTVGLSRQPEPQPVMAVQDGTDQAAAAGPSTAEPSTATSGSFRPNPVRSSTAKSGAAQSGPAKAGTAQSGTAQTSTTPTGAPAPSTVDSPLPANLSVWNWLRQSEFAPQTSFEIWQAQNNPQPAAAEAQPNAEGVERLPDTQLASATTAVVRPPLKRGTLIEAVPPAEMLGRHRLLAASPIELVGQSGDETPPEAPAQTLPGQLPDTGIQSGEGPTNGPLAPKQPGDDKKFGKAPVDYTREFLRTQSVLLRQGQLQFDTGAAYGTVETNFPTIVNGNLTQGLLRRRLAYIPLQLRYGLTDRIQMFANIPVGYVNNEQTVLGQYANYSGRGGTGDLNVGASYWLRRSNGCPWDPDIITTFGMTFPLAPASYLSAFNTPQASLGQGFWAVFWNVLVIQTLDPVTVFYGVGGRQLFAKEVDSQYIQPGQQFNYQCGAGFAVNERVTLSAGYFGYFITDTYIDKQRLAGSFFEPQYVRLAVTCVREHRIIEPFVLFGTTLDAARSIVGVNMTFY